MFLSQILKWIAYNMKRIKLISDKKANSVFIVSMICRKWGKRQAKFGRNFDDIIRKKIV